MLNLLESSWTDLWNGADAEASVGVVFTRPEIVSLILDLAGYRVGGARLAERRVLEPSCGDGAFLAQVVERLIASEREHGSRLGWNDRVLDNALRAVDISAPSLQRAKASIVTQLVEAGCPAKRGEALAATWTVHTDFLLESWPERFDFVIGNPPYVRIEELPRLVLERYREMFETTTDRADLYVAFIQKGLELLSPTGVLAYICANRFAKNKYGTSLRRLISRQFRVRHYLNLEHTQPFLSDVSAYPAIVVIDREAGKHTLAGTLDELSAKTLAGVRREALSSKGRRRVLSRFKTWYPSGEPWATTSASELGALQDLVNRFPVLEDSAPGTKVGIGVATGADKVFVLKEKPVGVEEDCLLPLLMASDIANDGLSWSGHYLLNPFAPEDDGSLVSFKDRPGFAAYMRVHGEALRARHVAKHRPTSWYRTIDRVWPTLVGRPKLVIPDIQGAATVGLDEGNYYPHHNVYWVTSDTWDLRALKALLRSSIVRKQVAAFSVQMRGGSLRYQAQTLRRLRVPPFDSLANGLSRRLINLSGADDIEALDRAALEAYGLA